jgi:curved DNA-binding protein CbpA
MALNLPPDPYLALGVSKDAKLPEIRSAHRKLVLKCHPDKVQDATLKAEKQDEFQKVQQAYEILSDDTRRLQYDDQVKLFELRKEMGRGVATPRSNPFEFEVRSAEPRTSSYPTRSRGQPAPKIYTTHSPPKTYDIPKTYEDIYDKPLRSTKKSSSYDSSERKRDEERQRELRKREDDDKEKQKLEREKRRTAHGDRKKTRDKEKRDRREANPDPAICRRHFGRRAAATTSRKEVKQGQAAPRRGTPNAERLSKSISFSEARDSSAHAEVGWAQGQRLGVYAGCALKSSR